MFSFFIETEEKIYSYCQIIDMTNKSTLGKKQQYTFKYYFCQLGISFVFYSKINNIYLNKVKILLLFWSNSFKCIFWLRIISYRQIYIAIQLLRSGVEKKIVSRYELKFVKFTPKNIEDTLFLFYLVLILYRTQNTIY